VYICQRKNCAAKGRGGVKGGEGVKGAYDEEVGTETWEKAGKSHMASAP
jgi:hypothetical protein